MIASISRLHCGFCAATIRIASSVTTASRARAPGRPPRARRTHLPRQARRTFGAGPDDLTGTHGMKLCAEAHLLRIIDPIIDMRSFSPPRLPAGPSSCGRPASGSRRGAADVDEAHCRVSRRRPTCSAWRREAASGRARRTARPHRRNLVLGADTTVVVDGASSASRGRGEARAMLRRLAGRPHRGADRRRLRHGASDRRAWRPQPSDSRPERPKTSRGTSRAARAGQGRRIRDSGAGFAIRPGSRVVLERGRAPVALWLSALL